MQLVAVLTRDEQLRAALVAVSCESLAQAMHVYLDGLGGGRRWALAPEIVDQALGAERLIRVQHEQRQQSALLVAPERDYAATIRDFQRAEKREIHGPSGAGN